MNSYKPQIFLLGNNYFINILQSTFKKYFPESTIISNPQPEEQLKSLLLSDIIVSQLYSGVVDSTNAVRTLASAQYERPKTFILVSSVQTWAETSETRNEEGALEPFSDDMFNKRIPHPKYSFWKEVEKLVKQSHSEKLRTYVIFSGLMYGCGEDKLHSLMKQAWHLQKEGLPIFGTGNNIVPMVHVQDLSTFVCRLCVRKKDEEGNEVQDERDPNQRYFFGADSGNITLLDMMNSLNTAMGNGVTHKVPEKDCILYEDIEHFLINVKVDATGMNTLMQEEEDWVCKAGFSENIQKITQEYKVNRGVTPLKVVVIGASHSGKTAYSEKISKHYKLPHITLPGVVEEFKQHEADLKKELVRLRVKKREQKRAENPEEEIPETDEGDDDDDEDIDRVKKRLTDVAAIFKMVINVKKPIEEDTKPKGKQAKAPPKKNAPKKEEVVEKEEDSAHEAPQYSNKGLAFMLRWKLSQPQCRNQGYILDGYPTNVDQAKLLFEDIELEIDENEEEVQETPPPPEGLGAEEEPELKKADWRRLPDNVILLTARKEFLIERTMNSQLERHPSKETIPHPSKVVNYEACAAYLESVLPNVPTPQQVKLSEFNVENFSIPIAEFKSKDDEIPDPLFEQIIEALGNPRNYGITPEERQQQLEKKRQKDLEAQRLANELAEKRRREEAEDASHLERRQKVEKGAANKLKTDEFQMLEDRKEPLKKYLMENVIPILTKGLIELCEKTR